jgi:hypothetical protein
MGLPEGTNLCRSVCRKHENRFIDNPNRVLWGPEGGKYVLRAFRPLEISLYLFHRSRFFDTQETENEFSELNDH